MPIFKNSFLNFGPSFGTHGRFTILSFLIVSIFTFSFTEALLFKYSLETFSKTVKIEKKTNVKTRLILNYIHPTLFHHIYMAQSKRINQIKNFPCKSCFYNRYAALWNIKISCIYHSANIQQKPTQSNKVKTICLTSSNMET